MLGSTRIHESQHHDDPAWTCHKIRLASDSVFLHLEADEVGGPQHRIMGFQLGSTPPTGVRAGTCTLTRRVDSIGTDNGLFIGMRIDSLLAIMRTPRKRSEGRYEFEFYREVKKAPEGPYEIEATLEVEAHAGRVTRLRGTYTERT